MDKNVIRHVCLLVSLVIMLSIGSLEPVISYAADGICTINFGSTKQEIDGFGGSNAWLSAKFWSLPEATRDLIMEKLFSPTKGLGLTIMRNRIPYDLKTKFGWRWDDEWDTKGTGKFMQTIKNRYGITNFFATPWTPPLYMKEDVPSTVNSKYKFHGTVKERNVEDTSKTISDWNRYFENVTDGTGWDDTGRLKNSMYQEYATFLADYIKGFKTKYDIDFNAISVQNEPDFWGNSSCYWTGNEIRDFIKYNLKPTLTANNLKTKIIMPESLNFSEALAKPTLADATASSAVDIVGVHSYGSNTPTWLTDTKNAGKRLWMTEGCDINNIIGTNLSEIDFGLGWAAYINDCFTNAEVNAFCYWWLFGDGDLLEMTNDEITPQKRYYAFGNFSKFIRPGYFRIEATKSPITNVSVSAYKDKTTGKMVVVAINKNSETSTINFKGDSNNYPLFNNITKYITDTTNNLAQVSTVNDLVSSDKTMLTTVLPAKSVTTFVIDTNVFLAKEATLKDNARITNGADTVGYLGKIEYNINVPYSGDYQLSANRISYSSTKHDISINGVSLSQWSLTEPYNAYNIAKYPNIVSLKRGKNTIVLASYSGSTEYRSIILKYMGSTPTVAPTPPPIPTPTLTFSDTFESSNGGYRAKNWNPGTYGRSEELVKNGTWALKGTIIEDYNGPTKVISGFEVGKTYKITAWLALNMSTASAIKSGIDIYLDEPTANANNSNKVAFTNEYFTAPNTYTKHEVIFTATQASYFFWIKTRGVNTERILYLDDLNIEKMYDSARLYATANGNDMNVTIFSNNKYITSALLVGTEYKDGRIINVTTKALNDIPRNIDFTTTVANCSATKWYLWDGILGMKPLGTVGYSYDE